MPKAKAVNPELEELRKQNAALVQENHALNARTRVAPVVKSNTIDAGDLALPADSVVEMASSGAPELQREEIEIPDGPLTKGHAEELAFNEELVEIIVHDSSDPLAEPIVEVYNNGKLQMFPRGMPVTCKRKYLEGLVRSKPVAYSNVEFVREDGSRAVKYPKRTSLRYPFQVLRDDNPRGRAWLAKIMAQQ